MSTWLWIVIVVAAVVILLVALWAATRTRRSKALKERFGPEYDRVSADAPSQRQAEADLREREKRREQFDIRPLEPAARDRYRAQWQDVQARFVDDPSGAVGDADRLVLVVMEERGYPMDDFERRADDISVDYPHVVEDYRAGHAISTANARGEATTEDLRQAMVHYRSLFDHLLGTTTADQETEATR